ncbi:hypothetical protein CTEN210_02719 [Chaetoceros tenuissimus]|uniref:Leucine-rich repeat domain-containing protein n=1 Tax=Chaetoceros tenuissimus TaxID=426638 RepID=A0AAD3CKC8_9STRA|nr:hypothetical protein CTEN210_02719 [Chaetoceros tenuissimus]
MRVQTEEWRRFVPGVRMYKGKKTFFYNGELIWDVDTIEDLIYDYDERQTWQVIMILPGVKVIPQHAFYECGNVKTVIMADTVERVEMEAFYLCENLVNIKLSTRLEYIGERAFSFCWSLTSIFIPQSCREICNGAFHSCKKLIILIMPQNIQIGQDVISKTKLSQVCPFIDPLGKGISEEIHEWIKNINADEIFKLHRICSSCHPSEHDIFSIVEQKRSLLSLRQPNSIGITPLEYLCANPFADIDQSKLVSRFVLKMMGETV